MIKLFKNDRYCVRHFLCNFQVCTGMVTESGSAKHFSVTMRRLRDFADCFKFDYLTSSRIPADFCFFRGQHSGCFPGPVISRRRNSPKHPKDTPRGFHTPDHRIAMRCTQHPLALRRFQGYFWYKNWIFVRPIRILIWIPFQDGTLLVRILREITRAWDRSGNMSLLQCGYVCLFVKPPHR